jgi:hypothetical protein
MGSEAIGSVTIRDDQGATVAHAHDVKALLESRELVLRGAIRRSLPIAELRDVVAGGERLHFRHEKEEYDLTLGAAVAVRWAKKILATPPTLASKLGISAERTAFVIGRVTDARLVEALLGATANEDTVPPLDRDPPASAASSGAERAVAVPVVAVAEVDDAEGLERALEELPPGLPIWVVHRKGRGADFGESAVRQRMRALGFIDTKVSAVSDARSATRYTPRPVEAGSMGRRL